MIQLLSRMATTLGNGRAIDNARRGLDENRWVHARIEAIARRYPATSAIRTTDDDFDDPARAA